jgi:hypothetical protein
LEKFGAQRRISTGRPRRTERRIYAAALGNPRKLHIQAICLLPHKCGVLFAVDLPLVGGPPSCGTASNCRGGRGSSNGPSPPAAGNPNVAVSAMDPMARHPRRASIRAVRPVAASPNPAPLPGPITGKPNIFRSGRRDINFLQRCGWRLGDNHFGGLDHNRRRAANINVPFNAAGEQWNCGQAQNRES